MLWSGIIVGLFIVFHIADLTWGATNRGFVRGDAYNYQIDSFQNPLIPAAYLLPWERPTMHLFHGLWSMTNRWAHPTALGNVTAKRRAAATVVINIGMGCASIPIAVLIGFLDHATPT